MTEREERIEAAVREVRDILLTWGLGDKGSKMAADALTRYTEAVRREADLLRQQMEHFANSDYRDWDEGLNNAGAWVEWAKSRALYVLDRIRGMAPADRPDRVRDAFESGYSQGHNDTVEGRVRDMHDAADDYLRSLPARILLSSPQPPAQAGETEEVSENFIHTKYGYCYYALDGNGPAVIYNLYVHPEYRRQGRARKLLQSVISKIRAAGYSGLITIEAKPRDGSIDVGTLARFYENVGLRVVAPAPSRPADEPMRELCRDCDADQPYVKPDKCTGCPDAPAERPAPVGPAGEERYANLTRRCERQPRYWIEAVKVGLAVLGHDISMLIRTTLRGRGATR